MNVQLTHLASFYPKDFNIFGRFNLTIHCEKKYEELAKLIQEIISDNNIYIEKIITYTIFDFIEFKKEKFGNEKNALLLDEYSLFQKYKNFPEKLYFGRIGSASNSDRERFNFGNWNINQLNNVFSTATVESQAKFVAYQHSVHQILVEEVPAIFLFRHRYGHLIEDELYKKQKIDLVGFYDFEKNIRYKNE